MCPAHVVHKKVQYAKAFLMDNMRRADWCDLFVSAAHLLLAAQNHPYPAHVLAKAHDDQHGARRGARPDRDVSPPTKRQRERANRERAAKAARTDPAGKGAKPRPPKAGKGGSASAVAMAKGVCFSRTDPAAGACTMPAGKCRFIHRCVNCGDDHAACDCGSPWDASKTVVKP